MIKKSLTIYCANSALLEKNGDNWDSAQTGNASYVNNNQEMRGECPGTHPNYQFKKCPFYFDTSVIPAYAFITSVTLNLYISAKGNNTADNGSVAYLRICASNTTNTTYQATDWTGQGAQIVATAVSTLTLNAWKELTIPKANINRAGNTQLWLNEPFGVFPHTNNCYVRCKGSNDATYKPQLVINYSVFGRGQNPSV